MHNPPETLQSIPSSEQRSSTSGSLNLQISPVSGDGQGNLESEDMLLEILSHGGFQSAQVTPDNRSSGSSSHYPDSPASTGSYYNPPTCGSRPNSRASSGAHSPGSISSSGNTNHNFMNNTYFVNSPDSSPMVSFTNF